MTYKNSKAIFMIDDYVKNLEEKVTEKFAKNSFYKTVFSRKHVILCDFQQKT
eukprot:TRINITY_DN1137_c0_g1_i1.p1 TRINITY_DN1137_c0_g1~~TRINITY_DN1137_c0_g1_i1.p1  ORF type:complete len:52 (-),score=6.52 TRINITY_DN1137_c0_g1_i1:152-307(-)